MTRKKETAFIVFLVAGSLTVMALGAATTLQNTDGFMNLTNTSNTSWTVNWNMSRLTPCEPGNYSRFTSTGFVCAPDQTSGANLSAYVPYVGATQDLDLDGRHLKVHAINATDSAGLAITSFSLLPVALMGVGSTNNSLFYGSVTFSSNICLGGVCRGTWPADTYANVTTAQADITAIKTVDATQNSSISTAQADITAIKTVDNTQNGSISTISTFAQTKAATGSVDCGSGNFLRVLTINNGSWTTTCAADSGGGGGGSSYVAYTVRTDFIGSGTNTFAPFIGATTSSGTSSNPAPQYGYPGIIYLRDSTTANGGYRYVTGGTDAYFFGNETFRMIAYTPATSGFRAGVVGYYGFHDATSITQPTDGCYFRQIAGVFRGECRNNAGPTITSTNYTVTSNTWYDYRITMAPNAANATFEIYSAAGSLLWNGTVAANIPNTSARVFGTTVAAFESTTDAAADIIWIDYVQANYSNAVTINR